MNVLLLNGPNLNLLGRREPDIYGYGTYDELIEELHAHARSLGIKLESFQSNHEGALIDVIQEKIGLIDGLVINPGGLTHTSVSLRDAVSALGNIQKVEVHISDVDSREDFRKFSFFSDIVDLTIKGKGRQGYFDALTYLAKK